MNTEWTLPKDAALTIPEVESISDLTVAALWSVWQETGFGDEPPKMSGGVVVAIFTAIKETLSIAGRLTPAAPDPPSAVASADDPAKSASG